MTMTQPWDFLDGEALLSKTFYTESTVGDLSKFFHSPDGETSRDWFGEPIS